MQQAHAAIPAKDGIVVSCWTDFFGLSERAHGMFKERQHSIGRLSCMELRFRTTFVCDPCVVQPLVAVLELLKALFGFADSIGRTTRELICEREPEQPQCELMLWFDRQDVVTDRLCLFRFAEAAIELRFGYGLGDACGGDAFQFVGHGEFLSQLSFSGTADLADEHEQRIVVCVDDPLFEWDDGVVGDVNIFGAYLSAALGDVA